MKRKPPMIFNLLVTSGILIVNFRSLRGVKEGTVLQIPLEVTRLPVTA
jgi:hypothetical protein